jgi:hypothetical protein
MFIVTKEIQGNWEGKQKDQEWTLGGAEWSRQKEHTNLPRLQVLHEESLLRVRTENESIESKLFFWLQYDKNNANILLERVGAGWKDNV